MKTGRIRTCLCALPLAVALVCASPVALSSDAASKAEVAVESRATDFPVVTLKHWQDSSPDARYGFLMGFATAVEVEKQWQGKNPLKLEDSLNNSWVRGLSGTSFQEIYDSVNTFIAENPDNLQLPLVEYLWYAYAQPTVSEKVSKKKLKSLNYRPESRPIDRIRPAVKGGK